MILADREKFPIIEDSTSSWKEKIDHYYWNNKSRKLISKYETTKQWGEFIKNPLYSNHVYINGKTKKYLRFRFMTIEDREIRFYNRELCITLIIRHHG